ncbi:MAG: proton-conducting membrane transporter, partial [Planctomycetes bacterium]|nr:proton-conducting membrane transporter [Planctomycetota bacterium]
MEELDLTFVDRIVERLGTGADKILEILQSLQSHYGYLPTEALQRVCERTDITPAAIAGVSTFYDQFRHRPAGKHTIRVCIGTACHVKGGQQVFDAFKRYLHIPDDEDTDAEKLFTIEKVACIGCCMLAPAIQIDDIVYGHLNDHRVPIVLKDFLEQEKAAGRRKRKERVSRTGAGLGELRICLDSSCRASGSEKVYESLKKAVHQTRARAVVKSVSCSGMSYLTPLVEVVLPDGASFRYGNVEPQDAKAIVLRHFKPRRIGGHTASAVSNLLDRVLTDENREPVTRYSVNVRDHAISEYLGRQVHIATEHCGCIDPTNLDEYLANGGFQALQKSLTGLDPQGVIDQIEKSGLRGRGGAGFPTHLKWATVRAQDAENKYVICNGDEGDPGAFMDRMLMESYPYRVLEGMAVAARCVGAKEGYLYIRAEYPLAIQRIGEAIERCVERGYLGDAILGSDFSLHLKIVAGAGAFVCGEETALIASIEGRRGM